MNKPTPTKRPLKKGDPCWVRIQRKGKPVLGVYDEQDHPTHWVIASGVPSLCHGDVAGGHESCLLGYPDAIFVAKPIPHNWREIMEQQRLNNS